MTHAVREIDRLPSLQELDKRLAIIESGRQDNKSQLIRIEERLDEATEILAELKGASNYRNNLLKAIAWIVGTLATTDLGIHVFKWVAGI